MKEEKRNEVVEVTADPLDIDDQLIHQFEQEQRRFGTKRAMKNWLCLIGEHLQTQAGYPPRFATKHP